MTPRTFSAREDPGMARHERTAPAPIGDGNGTAIVCTLADGPLGRLPPAATERGVCCLSLGNDDGEREAAPARRFPGRELRRPTARCYAE
jgi:hypothetical protein